MGIFKRRRTGYPRESSIPMITAKDLETLGEATLQLYAPDLHAGNWVQHAFTFIKTLVSADMVNYGNLDPKKGTLQAATTCDGSSWPKAVAGFGAFMKKYPYFCFDPEVNEGRPFFRSDFISAREFRDLDIYSECFSILETMDHAAVYVPTDDGCLAWFAAERGGRTDFDERDRTLLTIGQKHLANARKLAFSRSRTRDPWTLDPGIFCQAGFTPRESEVAVWLVEGKTNVEIAMLLKVHAQTVKGHVTALFNKTGTGNRLALTLHLLDLARTPVHGPEEQTLVPVKNWARPENTREDRKQSAPAQP